MEYFRRKVCGLVSQINSRVRSCIVTSARLFDAAIGKAGKQVGQINYLQFQKFLTYYTQDSGKIQQKAHQLCWFAFCDVTICGYFKHHAKNHPAMPSGAAKTAAFVFFMIFRTAYTLISENNRPLMCKHDEFGNFLKSAMNSNM